MSRGSTGVACTNQACFVLVVWMVKGGSNARTRANAKAWICSCRTSMLRPCAMLSRRPADAGSSWWSLGMPIGIITIKQNTKEFDEFLGSHDMFFHVFSLCFMGYHMYILIYIYMLDTISAYHGRRKSAMGKSLFFFLGDLTNSNFSLLWGWPFEESQPGFS